MAAEKPRNGLGMSIRQGGLVAGLAYLLNPVSFAELYAMPHLLGTDSVQTAQNMTAHPRLFALAVLSYFFSALGDVVVAWALYVMLAPVHRALAALGSILQLVYAASWIASIAQLGALYRLVAIPDYARDVNAAQLPFQVTEILAAYRAGWGFGLFLFGLHLMVTGWLMFRSTYLPRWLGALLLLDGAAWLIDNLSVYLYPDAALDFVKPFFLVELIFTVWLLGWGWRIRDPEPKSAAADPTSSAP